jgi:hypothetical protein
MPVRLDSGLLADARAASEIEHRTPAMQIEYWAMLGRTASRSLGPEMLRRVLSGTARVVAEPVEVEAPEMDAVLAAMEADTRPPRERVGLSNHAPAYQASTAFPGCLERLNPDGTVEVGQFREGEFHTVNVEAEATAAAR